MNLKELVRRTVTFFDLQDALVFGGLAAVTVGASEIYAPLGWIVPGIASMLLGLYTSQRGGT